jgi:positive regulator of sigma E activity
MEALEEAVSTGDDVMVEVVEVEVLLRGIMYFVQLMELIINKVLCENSVYEL